MKIAIYGRNFDSKYNQQVQALFNKLHEFGNKLYIFKTFFDFLKSRIELKDTVCSFTNHTEIRDNVDFLISIGGDGTLLDTVSLVRDSGIPVIGFNTGRMGFLSSISVDEMDEALNVLMSKNFSIEQRSLLRMESESKVFGEVNYALNELTIHKKDSASMMLIHATINGEYLNSYWADGLIISTPTGSTAYSLSCGGPLMMPDSENFIITPIAPHNLNVRPMVISDKSKIDLKIEGRSKHYLAALDSRSATVKAEETISITKANFKFNLIRIKDLSFLHMIRKKLMWGMDLRN
jgi:NAD+ kinase